MFFWLWWKFKRIMPKRQNLKIIFYGVKKVPLKRSETNFVHRGILKKKFGTVKDFYVVLKWSFFLQKKAPPIHIMIISISLLFPSLSFSLFHLSLIFLVFSWNAGQEGEYQPLLQRHRICQEIYRIHTIHYRTLNNEMFLH